MFSGKSKYHKRLQCRFSLPKFAWKRIPTTWIFLSIVLPFAHFLAGKIKNSGSLHLNDQLTMTGPIIFIIFKSFRAWLFIEFKHWHIGWHTEVPIKILWVHFRKWVVAAKKSRKARKIILISKTYSNWTCSLNFYSGLKTKILAELKIERIHSHKQEFRLFYLKNLDFEQLWWNELQLSVMN